MRGILRTSLLAVFLLLGACTTAGDYFSAINPFADKDTPLPGKRQPITSEDPNLLAPSASNIQPLAVPPPAFVADWPNPGGPASNSPFNAAITSGTQLSWEIEGSETSRLAASPIISNGHVFLYTPRRISAYSLATGKRVWSVGIAKKSDTSNAPGGGIATDGRAIYATSSLRVLTALDIATGRPLWSRNLAEPPRSAPTVSDGRIYFVSTGGVISASSVTDGTELWRYTGLAGLGGLVSASSPAVSGDLVVVPFASGEVVALDASSGSAQWSGSLTNPAETSGVSVLSDVPARPIISNATVYAGSLSGRFLALQAASGQKIWERNIPTANTPVAAGNGIFVLTLSGDLYALDYATGIVRWMLNLPKSLGRSVWTGPVLANSTLWLVSSTGQLVGVDAGTGLLVSQKELGEGSSISPIAASGKLVIAAQDGGLIALQ